MLLWLAGAKYEVRGIENLPKSQAVYISNHQSHFDIPAIMASIPTPFYFVAKKELKHIPIFGWGMWSIGMIFVDRSNREKARASMKKAGKEARKGKAILSFPEGTRSKNGQLQAFKKGAFFLAKAGELCVIPISVSGTNKVLPPGGKLKGGDVIVEIGTPISAETVMSEQPQDLARLSKEIIEKMTVKNQAELAGRSRKN